jgi:hypothetical protein
MCDQLDGIIVAQRIDQQILSLPLHTVDDEQPHATVSAIYFHFEVTSVGG